MQNVANRYKILILTVYLLILNSCSGNSTIVSAPDVILSAASGLAWTVATPSYSLTLHPTWTLATGGTIASQSIQYYAGSSCATPVGSPVALSSSATTDSFSASNLSSYSYKVSTTSSSGSVVTSACSSVLTTDISACVGARLTNTPYADGTGTTLDPFLICTATQMNAIGTISTDWNKNFKLLSNIDLSAYTGTQYNIIGTAATNFTGVFDGNNKTISNFSLSINTATSVGLFGNVSGAQSQLKNITLSNLNVSANKSNVQLGGLVGTISNGSISNCTITSGAIQQGAGTVSQAVGGLAGFIQSVTITNSISGVTFGAANAGQYVGGLIGYADASTITNSGFTGDFTAGANTAMTGGLVGYLNSSTLSQTYSTGTSVRNVSAFNIGGLVGAMYGNSDIIKSFSTSIVNGQVFNAGGLVGLAFANPGHGIIDSYAKGSVDGTGGSANVGALVGFVAGGPMFITNCYATGAVGAGATKGALIGSDTNSGANYATYTGNFWNSQLNAMAGIGSGPASAGNTGVNTATLQLPATFSGAGWTSPNWNLTTSGIYLKLGWEP